MASTAGWHILDIITSEARSEPCIKDDERKANVKKSPMKQFAIVHSKLMTTKGDEWLETPGDRG